MEHAQSRGDGGELESAPHFSYEGERESQAWEQIDAGRYMPRRIRGSCKGRALG
jgi:hypothetical protein